MIRIQKYCSVFIVSASASVAQAAAVDLSTWSSENHTNAGSASSGSWNVNGSSTAVTQTNNGVPTFFYSDFDAAGSEFTTNIRVNTSSDDDFIGFALGYEPGDSSNTSADYLLIDWKQGTQSTTWSGGLANATPGSSAGRGLALSRVQGTPSADEFWGHYDAPQNSSGGLTEIARGLTLGSTGWSDYTTYAFTFDFGPNNLEVYVDNVLQFDVTGNFNDGRFAFYNFSQGNVTYSGIAQDQGSFPVPEPGTLGLLALLGIGLRLRKAQH